MSVIAAIFVGGGIGSVLRHLLSSQIGTTGEELCWSMFSGRC